MNVDKIILFLVSSALLLPCFALAQSLSLVSDKSAYMLGEEIPVTLVLNTSDKLINVVDGTVNFSSEYFDIQNITMGNSILALWPKRPGIQNGAIGFTGGVPHGYNGPNGNIFNFTLKPKKTGEQSISIANASLLLNDGLGTKVNGVTLEPLKISIVDPGKKPLIASSKTKTASQQITWQNKKAKKINIKNVKSN
jgi:hypothetical protein